MRPILLKGHERALTCVKYNEDGDLLFSAAKDTVPTLWLGETGERMGTYNGHLGAVWDLDPSWDSEFLITAGSDQKSILFRVETGEELMTYEHTGPVRSVAFNDSATRFASCSDRFSDNPAAICVWEVNRDTPALSNPAPLQHFEIPPGSPKCTRVSWINHGGKLNGGLLCGYEDGMIRILDPDTGRVLLEAPVHVKQINRISFNREKTLLFTASADCNAKMVDVETLEVLQVYETDRPVNSICPHPTKDHVLLGGGQEAMSVTTTSGRVGKFECRFFEAIYNYEFGRVKGHFGPIHTIAVNPDGRSYVSGSEDGYVRLHHFDQDYVDMVDPVPEELIKGDPEPAGEK